MSDKKKQTRRSLGRVTPVRTVVPAMLCVILGPAASLGGEAPQGLPTPPPFAVVELFTSEGCSSCPPADRLLGGLVEESRRTGQAIYPLAFHVDYWDGLGWKDRFSDAAYTRRQSEYSRLFGADGAYTPQMIVNGREEFVGSDAARLHQSLAGALKRRAAAAIALSVGEPRDGALPVSFTIQGGAGGILHLAVVERKLITRVGGGENSGRQLAHENVVRAFQSLSPGPSGKGHAELHLPDPIVLANATLIGYLQDARSLAILGAAATDLR